MRQLAQMDLPRVGVALLACLFVLAALGALRYVTGAAPLRPFDADGELTVPAFFSATLLLAAGAAAWASTASGWARRSWAVVGFGVFLTYMAVDEIAVIHERLGGWTGLGESARELPIVLAGALLAALTLWELRSVARAATLFAAGGAAWFAAQLLEKVELSGRLDSIYGPMMLAEETLEPAGSALFLAAFALVVRARAVRGRRGDE